VFYQKQQQMPQPQEELIWESQESQESKESKTKEKNDFDIPTFLRKKR
jgi:hypothetical protein